MNIEEFKTNGHKMVDWMYEYLRDIEKYPIKPNIKPKIIYDSLPNKAPFEGEKFDRIFDDFEKKIIPGMTHWQNPNFHAFFPANSSYPSILAEMLISTMGAQCMMWDTSPAATELEELVTDWIKDSMGLPKNWKGVINDTASVGTICSLITAREDKTNFKSNDEGIQNNRFKIYCSKEAHSSVEKAVRTIGIGSNNLKKINTNSNLSMNFIQLENEIKKDLKNNYTPLAVISTFGTNLIHLPILLVYSDSLDKISVSWFQANKTV